MKKNTVRFFLLFTSFLVLVACTRNEEDFEIYKPPNEVIAFSNVSDFIIDSTGKAVHVKATIEARNGLQKVEVVYQPWNEATTVSTFANPNLYSLDLPVTIPANAALQIHSIVIRATDKSGNTNFTEVKIGLQDLDYSKLYLADVSDMAPLDSALFGVPIAMEKTGSHSYQVVYYSRAAGTRVKFIPNQGSMGPVAIGKDPSSGDKLITDALRSVPVELAAKGYYKISVNTLLLSYTVETITPQGTPYNQVALVGRGFYDYPSMNWQNTLPDIILLEKDANNPFLFTREVKVGIPPGQSYNTAQFIITTNNGWTDFWRFDNASSPGKAVFNGGSNAEIPITGTPATYLFIFDTYTNQVMALKKII